MRELITQDRLKEALRYDPLTGDFMWLEVGNGRIKIGQKAGNVTPTGYVQIKLDRRLYRAHRLAWLYMTGAWPKDDIDHRDRNRANNIWTNLRAATRQQNCYNGSVRKNNKSGFKGVCWHKASQSWVAATMVNGKSTHLGCYRTPEKAHAAYKAAVEKHHGEFARAA